MTRAASASAGAPLGTPEELLAGTILRPLLAHRDERGLVAEFYRSEWAADAPAVQWTLLVTEAGVMRGVHVHLRHVDYVTVLDGRCELGLEDLRPGSPTEQRARRVTLRSDEPAMLRIPPGVLHGMYAPERMVFALGLSRPYDAADELGCHWADPELRIDWSPMPAPRLSARDASLPPLRALLPHIPRWTPA